MQVHANCSAGHEKQSKQLVSLENMTVSTYKTNSFRNVTKYHLKCDFYRIEIPKKPLVVLGRRSFIFAVELSSSSDRQLSCLWASLCILKRATIYHKLRKNIDYNTVF